MDFTQLVPVFDLTDVLIAISSIGIAYFSVELAIQGYVLLRSFITGGVYSGYSEDKVLDFYDKDRDDLSDKELQWLRKYEIDNYIVDENGDQWK